MHCRHAKEADIEQLSVLSELCFGDDENYQKLLYQTRFSERECFIAELEGEVKAFAFAFRTELVLDRDVIPSAYLYSVGTHPDTRGKGLSTELLEYIWKELNAQGIGLAFLMPAEETLEQFYEQRAYRPWTEIRKAQAPTEWLEISGADCKKASPEEYFMVREKLLENIPHIRWDISALRYQEQFSMLAGGGLFLLSDGCGCATAEQAGNRLWLKEILASPQDFPGFCGALMRRFQMEQTCYRTIPIEGIPGKDFLFSMLRNEQKLESKIRQKQVWFGLALD